MTASWVIIEAATGQAILEAFDKRIADAVNKPKYEALPVLTYLQLLNERIKNASNKT